MSSTPARADPAFAEATVGKRRVALVIVALLTLSAACATSSGYRRGREAEQAQDFDRAVVEYTMLARANPSSVDARTSLQRAKLRASQDHAVRGRRMAGMERYEEAVAEYQLAAELNPTDAQVDTALREARHKLRTKLSVTRAGQTQLESLIARTRDLPAPGLELPQDVKLPGSLVFGNGATSRAVFLAVGRFANISTIF